LHSASALIGTSSTILLADRSFTNSTRCSYILVSFALLNRRLTQERETQSCVNRFECLMRGLKDGHPCIRWTEIQARTRETMREMNCGSENMELSPFLEIEWHGAI
jgi:hypothetical protein